MLGVPHWLPKQQWVFARVGGGSSVRCALVVAVRLPAAMAVTVRRLLGPDVVPRDAIVPEHAEVPAGRRRGEDLYGRTRRAGDGQQRGAATHTPSA